MSHAESRKIRILFIDSRADLGGGSIHLRSILEKIDLRKFEIYTAAPDSQALSELFQKLSQEFFPLPFRKFSFSSYRSLLIFIENHKINLIHSHGRGAGIYGRLAGKALHLPVLHTFHGVSVDSESTKQKLAIQLERYLAQFTTRFIHVSPSEREFALSQKTSDENRSLIIPNGIDPDRFKLLPNARKEIREKLHIQNDETLIGCVARFDPCKRHEDLIDAMSQVVSRTKAKLVLIGTGEEESKIKLEVARKKLEKQVIFLGAQNNIAPYYQAFDLLVLPSLFEGLPLVPLEAMASQCPVLLTKVRGNNDLAKNEETGLLVPPKRPDLLAEAIVRLGSDQSLRQKLSKNAYAFLLQNFSLGKMIESLENLYMNLCPFPEIRRVALVHDWLFHMRGGEKVLEEIGQIFQAAPIYTLFLKRKGLSQNLNSHLIHVSWLNRIPGIQKFYRYLLPILPFAVQWFRLPRCNLVISSSHAVAKGFVKPKSCFHLCYCHAPMRYVWGFESEYFGRFGNFGRKLISILRIWLRKWDLKANESVDWFVANSHNVKNRIKQFYLRESTVIHPPVKTFAANEVPSVKEYFLVVSALVPYKRVDLAIQAFNDLNLPLFVIGSGPLENMLKRLAKSNIRFLGWLPDEQVAKYYQSCRALIFPTEEDFGMVPVEAMMHGKPVLAYHKGGALETVTSETGVFFNEQTKESLINAVLLFQKSNFDSNHIKRHAEEFAPKVFEQKFRTLIHEKVLSDGVPIEH